MMADLSAALAFSADDLAANRDGHLSAAQTARLRAAWRRQVTITALLVLALMIAATVLIFFGQRGDSGALVFIGMALTVINAVIVGRAAQYAMRVSADTARGSVTATRGVVNRTVRVMSARVTLFVLKVDGREELIVSKPVFNAFEEGKPYAFYRAAASKTLLSAEQL